MMEDSQIGAEGASEAETEGHTAAEPAAPVKRPRGRPPKSESGATTTRRRGRPAKSATARKRGRPATAESLVAQFEREVEARFQARLAKSEAMIESLKTELKEAKKRERSALKLFEKQEKALTKFITSWNSKAIAKASKVSKPGRATKTTAGKKRRGRPPKSVS